MLVFNVVFMFLVERYFLKWQWLFTRLSWSIQNLIIRPTFCLPLWTVANLNLESASNPLFVLPLGHSAVRVSTPSTRGERSTQGKPAWCDLTQPLPSILLHTYKRTPLRGPHSSAQRIHLASASFRPDSADLDWSRGRVVTACSPSFPFYVSWVPPGISNSRQ